MASKNSSGPQASSNPALNLALLQLMMIGYQPQTSVTAPSLHSSLLPPTVLPTQASSSLLATDVRNESLFNGNASSPAQPPASHLSPPHGELALPTNESADEPQCTNPNCPAKGHEFEWVNTDKPGQTLCLQCSRYEKSHQGVRRSAEMCNRYYFKRKIEGRGTYVALSKQPFSEEQNQLIYNYFQRLPRDASNKDRERMASHLSDQFGRHVRSMKAILDHVGSDTYKIWKAEHEQKIAQSSSKLVPPTSD